MATISKEAAEALATMNGQYQDDPPAYAIFEYVSCFTGQLQYAVIYYSWEMQNYYSVHKITRFLWHSRGDASET